MADGISATLAGAQELEITLQTFKKETKNKLARNALRAACKPILDQAKENFSKLNDPNTPEDVSKNLVLRFNSKSFRRRGVLSFSIGVRGGAKSREENEANPGGDTYYWRFVELGTKHSRRFEPILSAVDMRQGQLLSDFKNQLQRKMMLEARRLERLRGARSRFQTARRNFFGIED